MNRGKLRERLLEPLDENKDVRASDLTPELKEAIGDYKLYEHGCCGGQRTAMWRHL